MLPMAYKKKETSNEMIKTLDHKPKSENINIHELPMMVLKKLIDDKHKSLNMQINNWGEGTALPYRKVLNNYKRKEGNTKSTIEHYSINRCKWDLAMSITISGQNSRRNKGFE